MESQTDSSGEINLIDGHVYSDGKSIFVAVHSVDHPYFLWSLYRLIRGENTLERPNTPGDLAGYDLDKEGHWRELRIGDTEAGENRLPSRISPHFEAEIMPTLEEIADSIQAYWFTSRMF